MLILHLLHPVFPSTVSRATWYFSSWCKPPLEKLLHQGVDTGCHKTGRCQWKVFWMGFQLGQLIGKAALHPSIHPSLLHKDNELLSLPSSCSVHALLQQMPRNLGLAHSPNTTTFSLPHHTPGSKSRAKAQQAKSLQTIPSTI